MFNPDEVLIGETVKLFIQMELLGKVKLAVGFSNTLTVLVMLSLQPLILVAINFTLYNPGVIYALFGLDKIDVVPSAKSHK